MKDNRGIKMKETKYWTQVNDFVDYWEGYSTILNNPETEFLTRKAWKGVHYFNRFGEYCILLKTGQIITNPVEVYDTYEDDWVMVDVSDEAMDLIMQHINGQQRDD